MSTNDNKKPKDKNPTGDGKKKDSSGKEIKEEISKSCKEEVAKFQLRTRRQDGVTSRNVTTATAQNEQKSKVEAVPEAGNTTDQAGPEFASFQQVDEKLETLQLMLSIWDLCDEIHARNVEEDRKDLERKRKRDDNKDEDPENQV